jgi:hypothetical protein
MKPTAILHAAKRTPLIKFLGKRQPPSLPSLRFPFSPLLTDINHY